MFYSDSFSLCSQKQCTLTLEYSFLGKKCDQNWKRSFIFKISLIWILFMVSSANPSSSVPSQINEILNSPICLAASIFFFLPSKEGATSWIRFLRPPSLRFREDQNKFNIAKGTTGPGKSIEGRLRIDNGLMYLSGRRFPGKIGILYARLGCTANSGRLPGRATDNRILMNFNFIDLFFSLHTHTHTNKTKQIGFRLGRMHTWAPGFGPVLSGRSRTRHEINIF